MYNLLSDSFVIFFIEFLDMNYERLFRDLWRY